MPSSAKTRIASSMDLTRINGPPIDTIYYCNDLFKLIFYELTNPNPFFNTYWILTKILGI